MLAQHIVDVAWRDASQGQLLAPAVEHVLHERPRDGADDREPRQARVASRDDRGDASARPVADHHDPRRVDAWVLAHVREGRPRVLELAVEVHLLVWRTAAVADPLRVVPHRDHPGAGKPEGGVSRLDIENALRFNNGLSLVTVTAEGLKQVLETAVAGVAPNATPGAFPQVAGLEFSFDPALPAGGRVRSLALVDGEGQPTDVLVQDGAVAGDAARPVRLVTLNFLADGGDGYPLDDLGTDRRDLFAGADTAFAAEGREQQAFADFLAAEHGTPERAYAAAETPPELDGRVQDLSVRADTVLEGFEADGAPPDAPVDWNALAARATANFEATGFWFV